MYRTLSFINKNQKKNKYSIHLVIVYKMLLFFYFYEYINSKNSISSSLTHTSKKWKSIITMLWLHFMIISCSILWYLIFSFFFLFKSKTDGIRALLFDFRTIFTFHFLRLLCSRRPKIASYCLFWHFSYILYISG